MASGLSIYWADPVCKINTSAGPEDIFKIAGDFALHIWPDKNESARSWFYDHFALGSGNLAYALNIHWFFAYIFMLVALAYVAGLLVSGSYRALLPRKGDVNEAAKMIWFYLNILPALIFKYPNPHPIIETKYNALQRSAYLSVSVFGFIAISSGWAIHKPAQLGWLQALFGGYELARVFHFAMMVAFLSFVVPHVVLVISSGWNCFRAMVVGWSLDDKRIDSDAK